VNGAVGDIGEGDKIAAQIVDTGPACWPLAGRAAAPRQPESIDFADTRRVCGEQAHSAAQNCEVLAQTEASGAPCWPPVCAAHAQSFGKVLDLSGMLHSMVDHRFTGNALSEVEAYEKHVDSVAGGLFGMFLSALPDSSTETKVKVAMLLELFGHLVDATYSQTVSELTMFLHSCGVSDRDCQPKVWLCAPPSSLSMKRRCPTYICTVSVRKSGIRSTERSL